MLDYQKWFPEARYGMFIHWGLYSLLGRGEWVMHLDDISPSEYNKLASSFNPGHFEAEKWARLAREAGMKYMVMTAKHHDGFCLFDSKYTDFTSVKTASGRDFVREYVEACRNEGLKVGIYFSCKDWQIPAYFQGPEKAPEQWAAFIEYYGNQLTELMTNYGKIDILWFDGCDQPDLSSYPYKSFLWNAAELEVKIRRLQPGILINNRSGMHADFSTPEQEIPRNGPLSELRECCLTISRSWGYAHGDRCRDFDSILNELTACACNGVNLLLNVSPDPDGVIPADQQNTLLKAGSWLKRNGEAFYGTERQLPPWWEYNSCGPVSTKGNLAYLFVQRYPLDGRIFLGKFKNNFSSACVLGSGQRLSVFRDGNRTVIEGLPKEAPDDICTVIRLESEMALSPWLLKK